MAASLSDPLAPRAGELHTHDAFISYASDDRRIASRLQNFLQRFKDANGRPLRVYLDQTHIRGGDLTEELAVELESSAALIVICSNGAAASHWVGLEIELFQKRQRPRVALVLAADEPSSAIPASLRSSEIRFHDVRRGVLARVWKPRARNELLRLVAWLTGAELSTLINWERRRLLKTSVAAVGALIVPITAAYQFAGRRRPVEASDLVVEIVLSWIYEEGTGAGRTIDEAMLDSPTLILDILPKSQVQAARPWRWPTDARRNTGMQGKTVRLTGKLASHALQRSPSTAGVWYQSTRRFGLEAPSLDVLADIDEWDGARASLVYSALGLGTKRPPIDGITPAAHDKELTAQAKRFYDVDEAQWEDMDYSIRGVPVGGVLTLTLRNQPVARAEAKGLRVWEHDEDVGDLHVLIFKPFTLRE